MRRPKVRRSVSLLSFLVTVTESDVITISLNVVSLSVFSISGVLSLFGILWECSVRTRLG